MHIDADQAHVSALNATDIDVLTPVSQRGRLQSKAGG
jgi:hypothetical protein